MAADESATHDLAEWLFQRAADAAEGRDLDANMRFYAPQVVMDATRTLGITVEGREALRSHVEDWMAAYDELEWSWEELVDLGNGVAFWVILQSARPVGTTGYVSNREGRITVHEDGLCVRVVVYPRANIEEARAAAERLARELANG